MGRKKDTAVNLKQTLDTPQPGAIFYKHMKLSLAERQHARLFLTGQAIAGILSGNRSLEILINYPKGGDFGDMIADQAVGFADATIKRLEGVDELSPVPSPAPVVSAVDQSNDCATGPCYDDMGNSVPPAAPKRKRKTSSRKR